MAARCSLGGHSAGDGAGPGRSPSGPAAPERALTLRESLAQARGDAGEAAELDEEVRVSEAEARQLSALWPDLGVGVRPPPTPPPPPSKKEDS